MTSLCGPAAFVECWARRLPEDFANYLVQLYTNPYNVQERMFRPDQGYLTKNNYTSLPERDKAYYMVLGAIRGGTNQMWYYDDIKDEASAMTTHRPVAKWFEYLKNRGAYASVQEISDYAFPEKSDWALFPSFWVPLLVDPKYIAQLDPKTCDIVIWVRVEVFSGNSSTQAITADHVVRLTDIVIYPNEYELEVISWGDVYRGRVKKDEFENNFFGAVIGRV